MTTENRYMTTGYKRKADDAEIVALNNVGMSLSGIAKRLNVHHTTVTYRLKTLGIQPADTRRSFMEDVFESLSTAQQQWLMERLTPGHSLKDFVRSMVIKEYLGRTPGSPIQ